MKIKIEVTQSGIFEKINQMHLFAGTVHTYKITVFAVTVITVELYIIALK